MSTIHLIGIGGAGLSAIATVLLQQNHTVSGSDRAASPTTDRLARLGATVYIGHRPAQVPAAADVVIVSSAIPADNPELIAARQRGLKIVKRAEWLGHMMAGYTGIAVAGTHGKTTTTAMLAFLLQEAGREPTYIIGGYVPQLATNAAAGQGPAFVIEADEYDYTFLGLQPAAAVVTTVEWDHPDIFPTPQTVFEAFVRFVRLVPADGLVVGCGDEPTVRRVIDRAGARAITYGLQPDNEWQAVAVEPNQKGGYDFQPIRRGASGRPGPTVSLALPGLHNVCNALAVLIVADYQGLELARAAEILGRFTGVGRRFEWKGQVGGVTVIDDYAHHPTEIKATLAAARTRFGDRRLWAAVQPHTFSRTLSLLEAFAAAFEAADHVVVVDIFASRETDEGLVASQDLVKRMTHPDARYIGPLTGAADYLAERLAPGDVLVTLGAGDSYLIGEQVLALLEARSRGA